MDKKDLPVLPKGWRKMKEYKDLKEVKPEEKTDFIKVEDIVIDGVYKTHVKDLIKILEINEERKSILLYNISGSFKQIVDFKRIALVEKI